MSELSIGNIRCFRPVLVSEARDRIEDERRRIGQAMTWLLASRPQPTAWSGLGATAAFAHTADVIDLLGGVAGRLRVTADVLTDLAQKMQACLELVRHADRRAAEVGGWLTHEGQLFLPQAPACTDPVVVAHRARFEALLREEIDRDLRQAQSVARQADHEVAGRLVTAACRSDLPTPPTLTHLPIPAPPPLARGEFVEATSAFANAAWWRALTAGEKGRAIREHPEWVGPRDGIPAWARHEANMALLTRLEAAAAADLAAVRQHRYGSMKDRREDLEWKTQRVESLRAIRDVISQRDGIERQLLLVDDTGPIVQTAVAVGDVDRAEHVATFVGGFTTTVRSSLRQFDRQSTGMRAEARSIARDGADVAVVAWLGYPAPQWGGVGLPRASVLGQTLSRGHADELAAFLNGLDAARDTPVHSTLWAHSYGSNVAGHALLRTVSVDDVVLFGSPGVPFRRLEQTGLKPNGLNVLDAPDDLVPYGGPELLGTAPTTVDGARRLATSYVKGLPNDLRTAHGHSEYTAAGTVARRNLVAVAAGRQDLVIGVSDKEARQRRSVIVGYGPVQVTVPVEPRFR